MAWAVKFEAVSKRYGGVRRQQYRTLRDWIATAGWRARPGLRADGDQPAETPALDRVSFEVEEGESLALIGPNGSGKTTALKLLTRISHPTGGRIHVRGGIGALIEVGSGLHPELTGRENVWLYGRIVGMERREIARRFDEIVEFAEVSRWLDMPVRTYSTGMQLRLGFAVASHLDPDILVVDEALAVGDARFQDKCIERMRSLGTEGRTLLFVSHNLPAVEMLCRRGLFLLEGTLRADGDVHQVLREYLAWVDDAEQQRKARGGRVQGRGLAVERVTLHNAGGAESYVFQTGETLEVRLHLNAGAEIASPQFCLGINDGRPGTLVFCSMEEVRERFHIPPGRHLVCCRLGPLPLGPRTYELWMSARGHTDAGDLLDWSRVGSFRIRLPEEDQEPGALAAPRHYSPVRVAHRWSLE